MIVLIANDHLLKGNGWLPGWLTGKLSDVAGLIVAPLLLCVLSGARTVFHRRLAFAAVAVPFAALNLFESLCSFLERSANQWHLSLHLWCDPTDLVAFLILPYTWRLSNHLSGRDETTLLHRWTHRASLILASLACAATSEIPPSEGSCPPHVINWTRTRLTIEVTKWEDSSCGENPSRQDAGALDAGTVRATELGPPTNQVVQLEPAEIWELGRAHTDAGAVLASRCGVATVRVRGGPSATIRWDEDLATGYDTSECNVPVSSFERTSTFYEEIFERAVTIEGAVQRPLLFVGARLQETEAPEGGASE